MSMGRLLSVTAALEIQLDLVPRWKGEGLDRLLDAEHARLVEALVRRYRAAGWEVAVETSFAIRGERGSIDVLAARPDLGLIPINEVKSVVPDAQATLHALDRKTRLALAIAAERGWSGSRVARFLVVGESRTARRRVEALSATFEAAYPLRGRAATAWVNDPDGQVEAERMSRIRPGLVSGLFFLTGVHQANAADRLAQPTSSRPRTSVRRWVASPRACGR